MRNRSFYELDNDGWMLGVLERELDKELPLKKRRRRKSCICSWCVGKNGIKKRFGDFIILDTDNEEESDEPL